MGYKAYKVYEFTVQVKVEPHESIIEAVQKLNAGEWENND